MLQHSRRWLVLLLIGIFATITVIFLASESGQSLEVQILHASDFEAGIPALEDAVNFSSVLNTLKAEKTDRTLILSSGDNYIMGPFFAASGDRSMGPLLGKENNGRSDIVIMNALGIEAAAFGNHEFDEGTGRIADLIQADDKGYEGANFPYLSTNLDFSGDLNLQDLVTENGQMANDISHHIAQSTIVTVQGERIGLVGATTPLLSRISSPGPDIGVEPANPEDVNALAANLQPVIDDLTAQGINKIILLAHLQQLPMEESLAQQLKNVDIIIAGGSHNILADETDRLRPGDKVAGPYPIIETSASGEPVVIVNTGANYRYVGRLVLKFDPKGKVDPNSIDANVSGAFASDRPGEQPADPRIVEVTDAVREIIMEKDGDLFGKTTVFLNGSRRDVRTQETNLGNLTADANLAAARAADPTVVVSIKNGGGIRDNIGTVNGQGGNNPNAGEKMPPIANPMANKKDGDISRLDIENALRFNNALSLVTVTAEDFLKLVEHSVAATEYGVTPGQFPQIGGFAFSFDARRPVGERVLSLAIKDDKGAIQDVIVKEGQFQGKGDRPIRLVTLSYLADGGDSYPFPEIAAANPSRFNRVDLVANVEEPTFTTPGTEQYALATYMEKNYSKTPYTLEDVPPDQDQRIQNMARRRGDTVLNPS
ncbi:bifunctional metallophosphatase/5'-nucleotidase [Candidatus Synechococcus calcipolaris G9]|uniref:Bifunctional metallophosphatase/5'-nucleotidase n=1 Tax=Candidatus Synechococcus calcipolaris G9 TaxID=1497997 RepID=A0ABT6F2X9_9SYNE|nr:bifunctional metallophosphatase/5'-nucleotidase [Candidatus Synechococcus calcipolaris]MDG2992220.1 bifunctional metallophosphatase/5'-nucleotidase [Candidatus Synechococcus calcipolaris G9]